ARGDVDFRFDLAKRVAGAAAAFARRGNRRAFAVALRAGRLHADDARLLDHLAAAAAVGADFAFAAGGGAAAVAGRTRFVTVERDRLVAPFGRFLERERHFAADVATPAHAATPAAAAAEDIAEDVAER